MKLERSDVKHPLWRKKVDSSLFNKLDTPIPNWLAQAWGIKEIFGINTSKRDSSSEVILKFNRSSYLGWVTYAKYVDKDTNYKLFFTKELAGKLKDIFIMSYMRSLEQKLRRGNPKYKNSIEDDIPFWEFLDIEFDRKQKTFLLKAHYFQKPIFPELFKQFVNSHLLKDLENKLLNKGDFKFIKEDWKPKSEFKNFFERNNIIYYLIDTEAKLLYIGEAEHTKRIIQARPDIVNWNFFRVDCLPEWITRTQRLELERLIIRSFASILINNKMIKNMPVTTYRLVNKKIDK